MSPEDVVRAIEELQALIDEGEGENSGLSATAERAGLDWDGSLDAVQAMLWNDLRRSIEDDDFDPDAEERRSIADFRMQTSETATLMLGGFLAGVRLERQLGER